MAAVEEHTAEVDGHLVAWRAAPGSGPPTLWLHGVPDSSEIWLPFLERAGGIAVDLPGFGRSGKRADFPYTVEGYGRFLESFCDLLSLDSFRLVMHDWGSVGLVLAMRRPAAVKRLVAIDVVPFLEGYRWHRVARLWRRRVLGELAMGATSPLALRIATGNSREWAGSVLRHFDHGTQRAILQLYRSADPPVLAAAGDGLGAITAPALVLWGERDRFLPPELGRRLAERLGDGTYEPVPAAGHWPWLDDPAAAERILDFLAG